MLESPDIVYSVGDIIERPRVALYVDDAATSEPCIERLADSVRVAWAGMPAHVRDTIETIRATRLAVCIEHGLGEHAQAAAVWRLRTFAIAVDALCAAAMPMPILVQLIQHELTHCYIACALITAERGGVIHSNDAELILARKRATPDNEEQLVNDLTARWRIELGAVVRYLNARSEWWPMAGAPELRRAV